VLASARGPCVGVRRRDGRAAHHAALLARAHERAAVAADARAARVFRLTFGQDLPLFETAKLYTHAIIPLGKAKVKRQKGKTRRSAAFINN
jgi:hypothetical protein